MKTLKISRFKNIIDGTISTYRLLEGKGVLCEGFALEPSGEDSVQSGLDRRIPTGRYSVLWHDSASQKQRLPLLFNALVPKSRYILIHSGNYPKHTLGCILVGKKWSEKGVFESKAALGELLAALKYEDFEVMISQDYN